MPRVHAEAPENGIKLTIVPWGAEDVNGDKVCSEKTGSCVPNVKQHLKNYSSLHNTVNILVWKFSMKP